MHDTHNTDDVYTVLYVYNEWLSQYFLDVVYVKSEACVPKNLDVPRTSKIFKCG